MKASELREKSADELNAELLKSARRAVQAAHGKVNWAAGQIHLLKQTKQRHCPSKDRACNRR